MADNVGATMPKRTWAEVLLEYLAQIEVEYIFGIPGGAIEPLYNALARCQQRTDCAVPKAIVARHEAGAAYMAEGYARESGKLGVCCTTTGPGATNLMTGIASAYVEKVPILAITAQTALPNFGKLGLQESSSDVIDTVAMFSHCTRYSSLISHPEQFEGKVITALMTAFRRPRGPVHLSIPMDLFNQSIGERRAAFQVEPLLQEPVTVDQDSLDRFCHKLMNAKKLVFFLGHGCQEAIDLIIEFAELFQAKIISSPQGKSWISSYHPLYCGVFGFAGHQSAIDALQEPDLDHIIAVGTSLSELSTASWNELLLNQKMIHIESAMENFIRSPMAGLHVFGNLNRIFSTLVGRAKQAIAEGRFCPLLSTDKDLTVALKQVDSINTCIPQQMILDKPETYQQLKTPIKPQRLFCQLSYYCAENVRFVLEAGNTWAWATHYLHMKKGGQYYIGMGLGAMAWAIGASIGIAAAVKKSTPVVCITGDGSYLMSGQEITVAIEKQLTVIFIILNDQALGMVKHGQRLGTGEAIGFDLPPVDFAAMARSVGAQGYSIRTSEDLVTLDFKAFCQHQGPTLLDVHIDPEEVPPMGVRIKTLTRDQQ